MYNYGSGARKVVYNPSQTKEEVIITKEQRERALAAARAEAFKKKALRSLAVISAIVMVIMTRNAQINKLCGASSKVQSEILSLNAMITEREMKLSYQYDMNNIDEIATTRLGMKKPDTSQYIYINVEKNTGGQVLKSESGKTGFSAFLNKAKILLEYLY